MPEGGVNWNTLTSIERQKGIPGHRRVGGFRIPFWKGQGWVFQVSGFGFQVSGFKFRVSGFGFREPLADLCLKGLVGISGGQR
jgi:hypothetical protein